MRRLCVQAVFCWPPNQLSTMQTPFALVSPYNLSKFIETGVIHGDIKQHSGVHSLHSSTARDCSSRGDTGSFGYPGSGAQAADGLLLQRHLARRPRGPNARICLANSSRRLHSPHLTGGRCDHTHTPYSVVKVHSTGRFAQSAAPRVAPCVRFVSRWGGPSHFFCVRRPAFQPASGRLC